MLASQTKDHLAESKAQRAELQRQSTLLIGQPDRLLSMRLADEIDQDPFARKDTQLRKHLASLKLPLDAVDRGHDETADLAVKASELSQTLQSQLFTADHTTKRWILEIVCLNCRLDGENLCFFLR